MHLLVPGAYRRGDHGSEWLTVVVSQCTFWCRVLTDGQVGTQHG